MSGLYAWLRRHPRSVDGALAVLVLLIGVGMPRPLWRDLAINVPFALCLAAPVVFRRRHPGPAFIAVIAVGALQVLLTRRPIWSDVAIVILLYTLAACWPRRVSLCGLAICLAGGVAAVARWHPSHPPQLAYTLGLEATVFWGPALLAWLLGDSTRWRRGYYQALEERAARLERERDAQARMAAAAERARIARELHDVVAHNVSVMVVQADGAAYALQTSPQRAAEALAAISGVGRRALAELRSLLGVLRDSGGASGGASGLTLTPQPGVEELSDLLEQARTAGLPVSLAVAGVPRPVPEGKALAVYRVVQEALTNVRKHAGPGVTAMVSLDYRDSGLVIRVSDDGRGASATPDAGLAGGGLAGGGHGLAGMRERIELYGGTMASGPRAGGGYEVVVTLPLALEPA